MATQHGKTRNLETFLKDQLEEAQKRFTDLEQEAEKVLRTVVVRGQESAKEVETLLGRLQAGELLDNPRVKALGRKATQAGHELRKRLDGLQTRVVEAVGVASQAQVKELNRELSRLSKKLDQLVPESVKKAAAKATSRVSAS